MHDHENGTPSGDRMPEASVPTTEETRRALYDAVVSVHFTPGAEEVQQAKEDPANHWVPEYTPEAAQLTVFKVFGRWFCVWRSLEEGEDQPEALRWTVLRIVPKPEVGPVPFEFLEV